MQAAWLLHIVHACFIPVSAASRGCLLGAWKISTGFCVWVRSRQAMYKFWWAAQLGTQDSLERRSGWDAGTSWQPATTFCMSAFLVGLLNCAMSWQWSATNHDMQCCQPVSCQPDHCACTFSGLLPMRGESSIWFRCADCQFTQCCYVHAGQCNQDNTAHRDFVWNKLLKQAGIRPDSKADE